MKTPPHLYLTALLLFVAGMGYLVASEIRGNAAYHMDVAEALAMPREQLRSVRVFGMVGEEGLVRDANSLGVRFLLLDVRDAAKRMPVEYKGAVPEGFKAGIELYAEGSAHDASILRARSLTTKCPSKYKKENRT